MTEGQRILQKAYLHISCGNGPKIEQGAGMFDCRHPRYPWSLSEDGDVFELCMKLYDSIAADLTMEVLN